MSNVSDREAQPRRQHQLTDGRRSRGYVPIDEELFITAIGHEALGLLAWIRRAANVAETDGFIDDGQLAGVAAQVHLKPARLRHLLQVLEAAGAVKTGPRGVTDVNNSCWSRTKVEREELRQKWLNRQRRGRGQETVLALPLSRGESRGESRRDKQGVSRGESREESRDSKSQSVKGSES